MSLKLFIAPIVAAGLLAAASSQAAAPAPAVTVVKILDGDTLEVLGNTGLPFRVRLNQIDAPEGDQPWGNQSADALAALVGTGPVGLVTAGEDQYGRVLATVYSGQTNLNAEMVRTGAAWAYRRYVTDSRLITLEQSARKARVGLWSQAPADIVEPERWRRSH